MKLLAVLLVVTSSSCAAHQRPPTPPLLVVLSERVPSDTRICVHESPWLPTSPLQCATIAGVRAFIRSQQLVRVGP